MVAFIKRHLSRFKEHAGIDVLDWRTEDIKSEINFQMLDFSQPNVLSAQQYDMATCMAVLHHVGNTDISRRIFLKNVRNAIHKNGRLLIEEDVILPQEEIESNEDLKNQVKSLACLQPHYKMFITMSSEDQVSVLTIIDLLANSLIVGVPNMAFPFGFKSVNEWKVLFDECDYSVEKVQINGFTENLFNQSSHVFFILTPN